MWPRTLSKWRREKNVKSRQFWGGAGKGCKQPLSLIKIEDPARTMVIYIPEEKLRGSKKRGERGKGSTTKRRKRVGSPGAQIGRSKKASSFSVEGGIGSGKLQKMCKVLVLMTKWSWTQTPVESYTSKTERKQALESPRSQEWEKCIIKDHGPPKTKKNFAQGFEHKREVVPKKRITK